MIIYNEDFHLTPTGIARKLKTSRPTIYDTLQRYEETGTVTDRPKSGRDRIYSASDEKKILKRAKQKKKATKIKEQMGDRSSVRTIQRRLKGGTYGKVLKVEKLSRDHKKKRVAYAKEMRNEKWRRVLFSDEKKFQLGAGTEYAWQVPGDREVQEYVQHAPKLNVWGAIRLHFTSSMIKT